jgi:hypothetical protein
MERIGVEKKRYCILLMILSIRGYKTTPHAAMLEKPENMYMQQFFHRSRKDTRPKQKQGKTLNPNGNASVNAKSTEDKRKEKAKRTRGGGGGKYTHNPTPSSKRRNPSFTTPSFFLNKRITPLPPLNKKLLTSTCIPTTNTITARTSHPSAPRRSQMTHTSRRSRKLMMVMSTKSTRRSSMSGDRTLGRKVFGAAVVEPTAVIKSTAFIESTARTRTRGSALGGNEAEARARGATRVIRARKARLGNKVTDVIAVVAVERDKARDGRDSGWRGEETGGAPSC